MHEAPELREQLRSLSIPREQRPSTRAAAPGSTGGRLLTLLCILAVLALAAFVGWQRYGAHVPLPAFLQATPATANIRTIKVVARDAPPPAPTLTATGKIVSDHRVQVSTKVSGQIVKLNFEQGQRVQQGETLAVIEKDLYRARVDEAAATVEKSKSNLEFQKVNFARIERLYKGKEASDIEYADARRAVEMAAAQLDADEAILAYGAKMLRDCEVLAPISGVILERNVEVGDFVAAEGGRGAMANSQFATIADMTALRVEVDVSELDIARLRTSMPCLVVPDAHKDRRYRGEVLWLDPGANYAKATVQVKVRIFDPDDYLRVDGAAQVQFLPEPPDSQQAPALWIPQTACRIDAERGPGGRAAPEGSAAERTAAASQPGFTRGAAATVYVRDGEQFRAAQITLGRRSGEMVEVVAGLKDGDEIAAEGLDRLAKTGSLVSR